MEIQTRFNVGDKAYYLNSYNRIVECFIKEIVLAVFQTSDNKNIAKSLSYKVIYTDCEVCVETVKDCNLFATPDLLCQSLNDSILKFDDGYNSTF